MKERGILFSAPMVRALLDGSKTQTRRALQAQPFAGDHYQGDVCFDGFRMRQSGDEAPPAKFSAEAVGGGAYLNQEIRCPYGQPGDRLWVRETWAQPAALDPGPTFYRADYPACAAGYTNLPTVDEITWKPSIHMFRKDSRILLEIISVRVERLNDCSEVDAIAEGIELERCCGRSSDACGTHLGGCCGQPETVNPVTAYRELWEEINGAGSWEANPWVWVVEFKRVGGLEGRKEG